MQLAGHSAPVRGAGSVDHSRATPRAVSSRIEDELAPLALPSGEDARRTRLERIAVAQVDLGYRNMPSGIATTLVVSFLMVVANWNGMPHASLLSWLAVCLLTAVVRSANVRAYQKRRDSSKNEAWRRAFIMSSLLAGICWGTLGGVLFPEGSPLHQMLIGFTLGGMVGGAAAYLSPVYTAYVAYAASAVLPFSVRLIATGEIAQASMGIMTIVFVASLVATARNMSATFTENIAMRIDKEDVAARLVADQQRIEQQSAALVSANEAALSGTRAKSEFLATMSHEIRTPLNAVIGVADLLGQTRLSDEQRDYVNTIRANGDNLLALVSDILDFSKLEAGRVDLEKVPFDLGRCVDEAIDVVASPAARKGLEILCEIRNSVPTHIQSDPTRLRQVLVNLLGNAVKFTPSGTVTVTVDAKPPVRSDVWEISFAVRDEGIGIPKDRMDLLFQSFSQMDASTTREYGGTGLGLAICKSLVGLLGGDIRVESEPGKGSTFSFTIQAPLAPARRHGEETVARMVTARGLRVALAVAHPGIRSTASRWLEYWLAQVVEGPAPDVVIADVAPGGDGRAIVRDLLARYPRARIIALLPLGYEGLRGEDSRVTSITKPLKAARLLRALTATREASMASVARISTAEAVPLRGRVALLAEDNEVNQLVQRKVLEQLGCTVDVVDNGQRVLDALRRREYDVVLLDMQMPVLDGLSTAREIGRQWAGRRRPKLIALTANALSGERERCLAAGMDDYLSKPVRRALLAETLLRNLEGTAPVSAERVAKEDPGPETLDMRIVDDLLSMQDASEASLLRSLVESLCSRAPAIIAEVRRGQAAGEVKAVLEAAHALKGSAGTIGAARLAATAAKIEQVARQGRLDGVEQLAGDLPVELERAREALLAITER